jgi:ABC-type Zn uptake system ZnuABC Zn-binding protein ZnuA
LRKIISCCAQKGLNVRLCQTPLYGDAMGEKGTDADHYLGMIKSNAQVLKEEWEK